MLVLLAFLAADTPLLKRVPDKYFRDLGNLMLAMVMLWAYMAFSQYLITYSGNTNEEIDFYRRHNNGNWWYVAAALIALHFAFPFGVLLTQDRLKKDPKKLARVALWIILMRFVDLFWVVTPTFRDNLGIRAADIGAPLLIGGIWLFLWLQQLADKKVAPIYDPRFAAHMNEVVSHG
jgi:hypothetical protein